MRVTAIFNDGAHFGLEILDLGYTNRSCFDLTLAREYEVYGVVWWKTINLFLIICDSGFPVCYPVSLFVINEARVADDWEFSVSTANEFGVRAILGYKLLVRDPSHYEKLMDGDHEAVARFMQVNRPMEANRHL